MTYLDDHQYYPHNPQCYNNLKHYLLCKSTCSIGIESSLPLILSSHSQIPRAPASKLAYNACYLYCRIMSTTVVTNPPAQQPSKSARKKRGKAEAQSKSPTATVDSEIGGGPTATEGATNGAEGAYESPYLKDLNRYSLEWRKCEVAR